jgi:hypothetical protein
MLEDENPGGTMENTISHCIACAEEIKTQALLCKHCGTEQDDKRFLGRNKTSRNRPKRSARILVTTLILLLFAGIAASAYIFVQPSLSHTKATKTNTQFTNKKKGHWVTHCITVQVRNPNANPNALFRDPNNPLYYDQQQCTQQFVND